MTKATDKRTLRLLIDGVLSNFGIDNLLLTIKLTESIAKFYDGEQTPRAKEQILSDLRKAIETGSTKQSELQRIAEQIESRVRIRPTTKEWSDFVEFCWREAKEGRTIDLFIDWWLADEWQRLHPPSRPDSWFVKWPQAFPVVPAQPAQPTESGGYR